MISCWTGSARQWFDHDRYISSRCYAILLLLLIVLLGNCANGDEIVVRVGVAAADNKGGFTVFAIPHMPDSVVLIILRSGLLGSHIFALISGDIVVLGELEVDDGDDADNVGEDDC